MADRFPYTKLDLQQRAILDGHLNSATRSSRNTETLRDSLELKYVQEVANKMYAGLGENAPTIYTLDSPMACAWVWAHTPKGTAERWRVFNDDFYTHPLAATLVDVVQDGYNAFTRLVEHTIDISIDRRLIAQTREAYDDLGRIGDLIATAIISEP